MTTAPTTTLNLYAVRIDNKLRHIEGATAAEALATLSPEERAAVYLISDDADLIFDSVTRPKIVASPQLQAATRSEKGVRWPSLIFALARKLWVIIVGGIIFALFYALISTGAQPTSQFLFYLIIFFVIFFGWMYLRFARFIGATKAINRDAAAKNWPKVLARIDALVARTPAINRPTLERACTRDRIRALIALNRHAEAHALVDRFAADPETRPEAVRFFRADLYAYLDDSTAALEQYRLMTIESPHCGMGWLTYAELLALEHNRLADARAALEHAKTLPIADPKRWFLTLIEGFVLLSEGRDQDAIATLTAARAASPHTFAAKNALHDVTPGTAAACLAITHARLNHTADAVRELNLAFALLSHVQRKDLLERAQREVAACEQRTTSRGVL